MRENILKWKEEVQIEYKSHFGDISFSFSRRKCDGGADCGWSWSISALQHKTHGHRWYKCVSNIVFIYLSPKLKNQTIGEIYIFVLLKWTYHAFPAKANIEGNHFDNELQFYNVLILTTIYNVLMLTTVFNVLILTMFSMLCWQKSF